jgi:UDP-2,3-diacylglucosamine pyrophosphatase LpxH
MRHTVAISDIHLCEIERTDGLWMRYRQAAYSPDKDLASMLDALRARVAAVPSDELCVVLNGDIFDFDAPRVIDGQSVFHDLPRTAQHAVPAIAAMLDDHPIFVAALGRLLADGHDVVFVSGNHDVLLTLPEVRAIVTDRLMAEAGPDARREKILFRAWFHRTPDGVVLEHGHQYDGYCAHRYPMIPFGKGEQEIQPTMGSLTARNLVSRMGYFNPHVDGSYMLTAVGYITHWARYYLFSPHSLMAAYARGALHVLAELVRRRFPASRSLRRQNIRAAAAETGATIRQVARHARLFDTPAEDRLRRVIREFWLDRVAFSALSILSVAAFLVFAHGPLLLGAVVVPALFLAYELSIPKEPMDATWARVQRAARRVARVHKARAVVLSHTHHPAGAWEDGVFYGNTGTWSSAYKDLECTQLLHEERPIVWLKSDASGELSGGLVSWKNGAFVEAAARPETSAATAIPAMPVAG